MNTIQLYRSACKDEHEMPPDNWFRRFATYRAEHGQFQPDDELTLFIDAEAEVESAAEAVASDVTQ